MIFKNLNPTSIAIFSILVYNRNVKKERKNGVPLMKNYYEILEVNPKASKEVIENTYKVLIEKYHPDLYHGEKQQYAEEKTKDITEAYKILSDEFLREQYNIELEKEEIAHRKNSYQTPNNTAETKTNNTKNNPATKQEKKTFIPKRKHQPQIGSLGSIILLVKELIQDLVKQGKNRKKPKEMTQKDIFAIILTIIIVIFIGIILWFIPFTNGWMRQLLFL